MDNRYFSPEALDVLLDSTRWRLTSAYSPLSAPERQNKQAVAWARRTSESHPQQEVMMALRGDAFFSFKGNLVPFRPGDLAFIDCYEGHGYPYPAFYPDVDHLLIQITGHAILFRTYAYRAGRELPRSPTVPLQGGSVAISLLEECLTRIRRHPELPIGLQTHQVLTALRFMIGEIIMQGFLPDVDQSVSRKAMQERMVTTVQEHIQDTAGRGISLDGLSTLTGYSKHHLLRLFRSFTGQTIHGYIETARVLKVKELLEQGHSKKEITVDLGFSCPAAFSRWLRARCPSLVGSTRRNGTRSMPGGQKLAMASPSPPARGRIKEK